MGDGGRSDRTVMRREGGKEVSDGRLMAVEFSSWLRPAQVPGGWTKGPGSSILSHPRDHRS